MAIKTIQSVHNRFLNEKISKEIFQERIRDEISSWIKEDKISFLIQIVVL